MEAMREAWTDERLDDLRDEMRRGFDRVQGEVASAKTETHTLRAEMNAKLAHVDAKFDRIDARFDALQRTIVISCIGIVGTVVAAALA